jgi:RNA-directed DNA polymerase
VIGTLPRLAVLRTRSQLAKEIGVPVDLLTRRAFNMNQSLLYAESRHRKRSGGERVIHAPYWPLANVQRKLLTLLEELYRPSARVMGFVKGRGIKSNATFHVGKRVILNIDLQNYFGSIHAGRIRRRLMARPYGLSDDVATTIAKLCTLDGVLPTGSSTSPILANIVTSSLDGALTAYARQHGCFYTRYADDISFSTNRSNFPQAMVQRAEDTISGVEIGHELADIVSAHGFVIQPMKTRVMNRFMRQEVCGVTCNERLNVRRTHMREVRGALNAWRVHGRTNAEHVWRTKFNWRQGASLERSLRGRIEHIIHIRGQNDRATSNLVTQFNQLPDRKYKDLSYEYVDTDPLGILKSVCLVSTADDDAMMWGSGSGFVVKGGSVITNYHVLEYQPTDLKGKPLLDDAGIPLPRRLYPTIEAKFDDGPASFRMQIVYADPQRDVAVLRSENPFWKMHFAARACRLSFRQLHAGDEISVVGYPNHAEGDTSKIASGTVTGATTLDGLRFFTISPIVVKGNSGGPVIDTFGQVVGIVARGVDAADTTNLAFNACIPLNLIDKSILSDV